MKKWKIVAIAMSATLALGGVLAGGFFAGHKYASDQYSIVQAEQENKLQDLESRLSSLNDDLKAKEAYIKELETAKKKLQSQYDELLEASGLDKQEFERLTSEIFDLRQQLETAENDKEDLQAQLSSKTSELERVQKELQEKESKISELSQSVTDLTQQVESYKTQLDQLQTTYDNLLDRFHDLDKRYSELRNQKDAEQQEIESLNDRISELEKEIEELNRAKAIDPFDLLSYKTLKVSDTKYLLAKENSGLFSLDNKFNMNQLSIYITSLNQTKILSNGEVLIGWTDSLYVYEDETDKLTKVDYTFNSFSSKSSNLEFIDGYALVSPPSSSFSGYKDVNTAVIDLKTYRVATIKNAADAYILGRFNNDLFIATSSDIFASSAQYYYFDFSKFQFEKVQSNSKDYPLTSKASVYVQNKGVLFLSNKNLLYYDRDSSQVTQLDSPSIGGLNQMSYFFVMSNGKVLMNAEATGTTSGLYLFDPETTSVSQVRDAGDMFTKGFDTFTEKNGKVEIKRKAPLDPSTWIVFEYDIASGTLTRKS